MNAQGMLEQLLRSGLSMIEAKPKAPGAPAVGDAGWGKFGAGAAAGGALDLLLGSVAALGMLAYKTYGSWQSQQQAQAGEPQGGDTAAPELRTVNLLPAPGAEQHSRVMLKSMIAAAMADDHLDERERGLVEAELNRLQVDPATRRSFEDELRRPLDPAEVARSACTPEMAAEMYLASLLVPTRPASWSGPTSTSWHASCACLKA